MSINLVISFKRKTNQPIDWLYNNGVGWTDVATANAGIPLGVRYIGQQVYIGTELYVYRSGIADADLVPYFPKKTNGIKVFNNYNFI